MKVDTGQQIATIVREVCRREELLADLPDDEDFFDHGLSSLAVIQMQIRIEEALKVTVPTSDLMTQPTIADWISIYIRRAAAAPEVEALSDRA